MVMGPFGCVPITKALLPLSERLSPNTTIELYRPAWAGRLAITMPKLNAGSARTLVQTIAAKDLRILNSLDFRTFHIRASVVSITLYQRYWIDGERPKIKDRQPD